MRTARAVALAVVLVGLAPDVAAAAALDHVTMYSDGDYIGGGQQRFYTPANAQISVGGSTSYLSVGVSGGTLGDYFTLEFAAPPGGVLQPGVYDRAQRAPFREAGRPGIDISGSGRGCNEVAGRFEVKDLVVSGNVLQRLWIVYEHHCEGGPRALFGEVRLGEPGPPGPVATAPSIVRPRSPRAAIAPACRSASTGPTATGGTRTSCPARATSSCPATRTARRAIRSTAPVPA